MQLGSVHNTHMPQAAIYKLRVTCPDANDFTLNSVITSPRTCNPLSLAAACRNMVLETDEPEVPTLLSACVQFILTDFFSLAHRTGLYNRQMMLWQSIGRITAVEAHRLRQGIFQKVELPIIDVHFDDGRGRTSILGSIVEDADFLEDDKKQREYLKALLSRAEKLKSSKGLTGGIIVFCPAPFSKNLLTDVLKQTSGDDPVGKYESMLPEPLALSIDLVEFASNQDSAGKDTVEMRLVHPDIASPTRVPKKAATQPHNNYQQ
jgi:hypothetical protein